MQKHTMEVSKKEDGQYKKVGEVTLFYPLLSELGLAVDPAKWEKTNDKGEQVAAGEGEDGAFPVYADERVQYAFDAILAAVKATARNRLQSGTATLKPDNKIAETIEELLATGERSGEALKQRREYFASFKAWLPSLGKSAAYVQAVFDVTSNVKNIPYQTEQRKGNIKALVTQHAATLSAEQAVLWERTMTSIVEACEAANPLDE